MQLPVPVGVVGAGMPPPGKPVISTSMRWIHNDGLRTGNKSVSPDWVILNMPNPSPPPAQLRRVPLESTTIINSVAIAYGITDWLSISAATTFLDKKTLTLTYAGNAGLARRGTSIEHTEGQGDSRIGTNFRLFQGNGQIVMMGLAITLPTGSITERIQPLQPNGQIGNTRAGYTLQLGTGTYDLAPTLSWIATRGRFGWGAAYQGRMSLESANDEGYRVGDFHQLTGWVSYAINPLLTTSLRLEGSMQDHIHGRDPLITGAGVGTNPENYGGERIDAYWGLQARGPVTGVGVMAFGVEFGLPLYEHANGVHLERAWSAQVSGALRF